MNHLKKDCENQMTKTLLICLQTTVNEMNCNLGKPVSEHFQLNPIHNIK